MSDGLRLLHVQSADATMHIGITFIQIWQQLPYWRLLAKLTAIPGIKQVAQTAYRLFAHWRLSA